jgi:hypothetical protein
MNASFDRNKSLQEIEGEDWSEPSFDSYLVTTIHRLRRKPFNEFTTEDLRIMIGQGIGLPYLIPMALERLSENPLAGGDFYPGDLLKSVLSVETEFWKKHSTLWRKMNEILGEVESLQETIEKDIFPSAEAFKRMEID